MEIINGFGGSLGLTPTKIESIDFGISSENIVNCSLYFFTGEINNDVLSNISTVDDLTTTLSTQYIGMIDNVGLDFIYDSVQKQRIIKQNPVDAKRFDSLVAGDITFCAIKVGSGIDGDFFIYTDEIGTFDNPSSINLDYTTATLDRENIVTSIKIDIRSKSVGEI